MMEGPALPVRLPPENATRCGIVQVYTGPGKGKTTAAIGLALRAAGHGWRVCIVQFLKRSKEATESQEGGASEYGEIVALATFPNVTVRRFGTSHWIDPQHLRDEDRQKVAEGLAYARQMMADGLCDLLILDEINVAMAFHLLPVEEVLSLIHNRPAPVEMVLTGRDAPQSIIDAADLVTRMEEIKHPYSEGLAARQGIEF
jgi:cob(I)alamin adenosyltransferase